MHNRVAEGRLTKTIDRTVIFVNIGNPTDTRSACNDAKAQNAHYWEFAFLRYVEGFNNDAGNYSASPISSNRDGRDSVTELCDDAVITTGACFRVPYCLEWMAERDHYDPWHNASNDGGTDDEQYGIAVASLWREANKEHPNRSFDEDGKKCLGELKKKHIFFSQCYLSCTQFRIFCSQAIECSQNGNATGSQERYLRTLAQESLLFVW